MPKEVDARIRQLEEWFEQSAEQDYIGEGVSQLDHALQAAHLAWDVGAPDHEVLAALLHDIGHLCAATEVPRMDDLGVLRHEAIGADQLEELGFGPSVTHLVRSHVAAKRYLVARRPDYAKRLSEASRGTLAHQGGPMSAEACALLEADRDFQAILRVRSWDEAAKVPGLSTPPFAAYLPRLRSHLQY
jgi:predicted HD phosphohydrolase